MAHAPFDSPSDQKGFASAAGKGIILPDPNSAPLGSNRLHKWIWFFLKPYAPIFGVFFGFRIFRYTLISLTPLIVGLIISGFEQGWALENPLKLYWLIAGFLIMDTFALLSIMLFIIEQRAEDRMVRAMTLYSVRHMNLLPLSWHEAQGSGSKLQRVMTARNSMQQMYNIYKWSLVPFAGGILAIFLSITVLKAPVFFYLLYAGFIGSFFGVALYTARKLPLLHDRHNVLNERLMSGVYEFVSSVRTVKAFHMGAYIEREAGKREWDAHHAKSAVFRTSYFKWTLLNLVGLFWTAVFILTGVVGTMQGWMTIGIFTATFFLASNLWLRLEELVFMQDQFIEHRNGFMRLTETLKVPPVSYDHAPAIPLDINWKTLTFDHVDFTYTAMDGKAPPALHDISLTLGRGEKIALVGRSGAGKSTFVKLLMKQMEPTGGMIRLDDSDLKYIPTADWLHNIGFVPQDVELFNMSIRENILLDIPYIGNEERYRNALRHAALDQLVENLPQGDETFVGERGIKLSGGQRQRLGIARALVRKADLIIFDEATASLDSLSENIIQAALKTGFSGHTMVIIAHRLSTVRFADRIVVMENGRIIEQGTFHDLIAFKGKFSAMWAMQSSGFIDGEPERESVEMAEVIAP